MAVKARCPGPTRVEDLIELRLLVELSALRRLTVRGLTDRELAALGKLARAAMRSAFAGDALGCRQAEIGFHLRLLELTGDRTLLAVGRPLLAAAGTAPGTRPAGGDEPAGLAAAGARDHCELVALLSDDLTAMADDLLRKHIGGSSGCRWGRQRTVG